MSRMTAAEVLVFSGRFFQASQAPLFLSEILRVMFVLVVSPKIDEAEDYLMVCKTFWGFVRRFPADGFFGRGDYYYLMCVH